MLLVTGITTFLITLLLSWSLLRPFWLNSSKAEIADVEEDAELASSRLKLAIEELESEMLMGKITEEEFRAHKRELAIETARSAKKLN